MDQVESIYVVFDQKSVIVIILLLCFVQKHGMCT